LSNLAAKVSVCYILFDCSQVHGSTMDIKIERGASSGAATSAVTQILGDFLVAISGGLLNGPDHNPNDRPEDGAITSTGGVSKTRGVVWSTYHPWGRL
jgi:hypothetical protein